VETHLVAAKKLSSKKPADTLGGFFIWGQHSCHCISVGTQLILSNLARSSHQIGGDCLMKAESSNAEPLKVFRRRLKMLKNKKISTAVAAALFGALALAQGASAAVTTRPTTAQKLQLQYLVEEEKLARDVYAYLAANVTSQKFSNIVKSEQTHMDNVAAVLKTYNFFNPTTTRAAGVFRDNELQALYNQLTAQGSTSVADAYAVGIAIEKRDISDLEKILKATSMPADMRAMMELLLKASYNHLAAFQR
jgi:hypothetical protein